MRVMEPLVFVELYRNGRYYLMRPMPMDYFEYYFQRMRGRSYFELVPDEYLRAFEEVNKNAIQKSDLKIEDVDKKVAGEVSSTEEIPFQWQADFTPSPDNKVQVNITVKLKYKDISYYQSESKYKADFEIVIKLLENEELATEALQDEINVELTEEELMAKANEYMIYEGSLYAVPGEYTIEIILENKETHISNTVTEELSVEIKSE